MSFRPLLERALVRRPRILNVLHRVKLVEATSQTIAQELEALERYAFGAQVALEIGTHQGVSAARIARALGPNGSLYCVDPWEETAGSANPCWEMCRRHLQRQGVMDRIRILRGFSLDVAELIPGGLDFVFVDGDHSRKGIEIDWGIVTAKIAPGGIICLHDSLVPAGGNVARHDSSVFFDEVIRQDPRFDFVEGIHSLAVLRRRSSDA